MTSRFSFYLTHLILSYNTANAASWIIILCESISCDNKIGYVGQLKTTDDGRDDPLEENEDGNTHSELMETRLSLSLPTVGAILVSGEECEN